MRRREFFTLLGAAAATSPLRALAQQTRKMFRIGYLSAGNPRSAPFMQAFEKPDRSAFGGLRSH